MSRGCDTVSNAKANTCKSPDREYQFTSVKHVSLNVDCVKLYRYHWFSLLPCARHRKHIEILDFVYIHVHHSDFCCTATTCCTNAFV